MSVYNKQYTFVVQTPWLLDLITLAVRNGGIIALWDFEEARKRPISEILGTSHNAWCRGGVVVYWNICLDGSIYWSWDIVSTIDLAACHNKLFADKGEDLQKILQLVTKPKSIKLSPNITVYPDRVAVTDCTISAKEITDIQTAITKLNTTPGMA
jgi:hypothetical protein